MFFIILHLSRFGVQGFLFASPFLPRPDAKSWKERSETKIEALQLATGDAFRPFERDGTFLFSPPDISLRRRAENEAPAALDGGDDDDDDFSSFLNPNHLSSFSLL